MHAGSRRGLRQRAVCATVSALMAAACSSGHTGANDLVFTALLSGTVVALQRTTGKIVWQYEAGGGINGWMAASGNSLYLPVGPADPPELLALRLPAR